MPWGYGLQVVLLCQEWFGRFLQVMTEVPISIFQVDAVPIEDVQVFSAADRAVPNKKIPKIEDGQTKTK